jgi:hypothetical protein
MNYELPILFIMFKRPQIAKKAFERIKRVRPSRLYLACDAARPFIKGESELVEQTKNTILNLINWECEVKTLFQDTNLGCANGVYTAINWLFAHEEAGIILEDDCVVQDTFFPFIAEMIEKYKTDDRIGMVDGANYIQYSMNDSYCFSKYKSTNGWATWRRSWQNMDISMNWRGTDYEFSVLANMGFRSSDIKYWKYKLKVIDCHQASAWDWQWYFSLAVQNQLSIFPKVSLVTNVGFGKDATHTQGKAKKKYIASQELSFPLIHPKYIVPSYGFDKVFYKQNNTLFYTIMRYIPFKIKNIIKNIIR